MMGWRTVAMAATMGLFIGCAARAPVAPAPVPPPAPPVEPPVVAPVPEGVAQFEQRQLASAIAATRQGRLADAALAWEVLSALRPERDDYRSRGQDVQRQIDALVAERLPRAAAAQRRGDLDGATQQYLAVLALKPDHAAAADALRAIERERNRRLYLGKLSRNTLARIARPGPSAALPSDGQAAAAMPTPAESNRIEHASMLAAQGELEEAIALLDEHLARQRKDVAARTLLADLYFQQAEKLLPTDRAAALAALVRSVQLDPKHPQAPARLKQLRATARNGRPAT